MDSRRAWYLSDLALHLGTSPSSFQRELAALVDAGILTKWADGNRTYYRANPACPIFPELQSLLTKTSGLLDLVRAALAGLETKIFLAFVYGSIAAGTEGATSDVDLFVVGSVSLADVALVLKPLQERLLRPVNPSLVSEGEFREKIHAGNHFLASVLEGPKLFIIGTQRDLDTIAERGARTAASDDQEGA